MIVVKFIEYQQDIDKIVIFFNRDGEKLKYDYSSNVFDLLSRHKIKRNMSITKEVFKEFRDLHHNNMFLENMRKGHSLSIEEIKNSIDDINDIDMDID